MSLIKKIQNKISKNPDGWVFSAADFVDHGDRGSVLKALSRLHDAGDIDRIAQGLYARPAYSNILKRKVFPPLDNIIDAMARRDNVVIKPSNAYAANSLGLTNVVQAKPVYVTNGKSRDISVGGRTVHLSNMGSKLAKWIDSPAFPAVQAMFWLGKRVFDNQPDLQYKLIKSLDDKSKRDLVKRKNLLPAWARSIVSHAA